MTVPPSIRDDLRDLVMLALLEGARQECPGHRFAMVEPDGTELTAEDLEARIASRKRDDR